MTDRYRWPPEIQREIERTAESLRQLTSSAAIDLQRQLDSSAVHAAIRQVEESAVEQVRRYLDSMRRQTVAFEMLEARINSPVIEAIRGFDAQHAAFRDQLQRTIAPLPDISAWSIGLETSRIRLDYEAQWAAINSAVRDATLLWTSPLPEREHRAEDDEEHPSSSPPSEQILRSVPAAARPALESVDLLPLRVLDRIYNAPRAIHQLTPRQFEELVAEILHELQFERIELTPRSADKGRDVVATKRVNGLPLLFAFECKKNAPSRKVGVGVVRTLLGTVNQSSTKADVGVLVTTSTFTRGAQNFFLTETRIKGRDFDGIVEWLNEIQHLRRDA